MPDLTPHERLVDALSALGRATRASAAHWEHAAGTLTRPDLATLKCIESQGEVRMSCLATAVQVHPSVISRQISALEAAGLVERRVDPDDRRAGLVRVTAAGQAQVAATSQAFADFLGRRTAHWDPARLALAADLIHEMADSLGPAEASVEDPTTTEELTPA